MSYEYNCTIINVENFAYNENEGENLLISYDDFLIILKSFNNELKIIEMKDSFDIYVKKDLYIFMSLTSHITDIVKKYLMLFYCFSMCEFEKFKDNVITEIKESIYEILNNTKHIEIVL